MYHPALLHRVQVEGSRGVEPLKLVQVDRRVHRVAIDRLKVGMPLTVLGSALRGAGEDGEH